MMTPQCVCARVKCVNQYLFTCVCECTFEWTTASSSECVRAGVCWVRRCVVKAVRDFVWLAPRICPLALASLNISLMSNFICIIKLELSFSPSLTHSVTERHKNLDIQNSNTKWKRCLISYCLTCQQDDTNFPWKKDFWLNAGYKDSLRMIVLPL